MAPTPTGQRRFVAPEHPALIQLTAYRAFYESLSMSVLSFVQGGTRAVFNIDSYLYSSIEGTLESIFHVISNGRIADGYALLRRYHDSAIINIYSNLFLKKNFSLEKMIVAQVDGWLKGSIKVPSYKAMKKYIESSPEFATINGLIDGEDYKNIRERCNDHTHYNFFRNVLLNDGQVYVADRAKVLDEFAADLEKLFIFHLSYLFFLNDHYMASSDYIDHLECGMTPPEGMQYEVAPFVQEIFDSVLKQKRPDIAEAIKKSTAMKLG